MPSKKIIVVGIVCFGIVVSVWIFERGTGVPLEHKLTPPISVVYTENDRQQISSDYDWQKILSSSTNNAVTIINNQRAKTSSLTYPNEGTLTDQLARDFFSQYLAAQKDESGNVSDNTINQIVSNTLSNNQYTEIKGPVYYSSNLKISQNADKTTLQKYYDDMVELEKILLGINKSAYSIVDEAVVSQNKEKLAELDPMIATYEKAINKLLSMTVPSDAVNIHLADLNSISNMQAELEAMRNTFTDPVKAYAAINLYQSRGTDFSNAVKNTIIYFQSKGFGPPNI